METSTLDTVVEGAVALEDLVVVVAAVDVVDTMTATYHTTIATVATVVLVVTVATEVTEVIMKTAANVVIVAIVVIVVIVATVEIAVREVAKEQCVSRTLLMLRIASEQSRCVVFPSRRTYERFATSLRISVWLNAISP